MKKHARHRGIDFAQKVKFREHSKASIAECERKFSIYERAIAEVLKGMITKEKDEEMMQYNVYIQVGEQKVEAGLLNEDRLKNLLISYVFRNFDKRVIFEDGETIVNDEIFALCPLVE